MFSFAMSKFVRENVTESEQIQHVCRNELNVSGSYAYISQGKLKYRFKHYEKVACKEKFKRAYL